MASIENDDIVRYDTKTTSSVLPQDLKTPDRWIKRDERMIRLTGGHPFNSEAPLTTLFEQGFITPYQLHYVRNHGPVPEVSEETAKTWTVQIDGLCETPQKLTLASIMSDFDKVTLPVTLVCAGNRRKEQNLVRKGSGFNWGAGGVSTSLWTGIKLCDLIKWAKPSRKARYVYFEGADKLPADYYGTCVRIEWARDFNKGILLAWKQNGLPLSPDHGFPLRVIVPGVIGGRSVKWLKRITFAEIPSENYYHIYDNRVLPTLVTPDMAKSEKKWWTDERYAIYNLNVQSVIVYPQHNERLPKATEQTTYTIRGYAYNGGGSHVGRVEVSLDSGTTWALADIRYPEDEYRERGITELFGGRVDLDDRYLSFCWCFWSLEVNVADLVNAKDIVVRAMDEDMNRQPREMYWSVMSMLNNCWFRVAVRDESSELKFEHPTNLLANDGWMDRVKSHGGNLLSPNWGETEVAERGDAEPIVIEEPTEICMINEEKKEVIITREELQAHANESCPWMVVNGEVYDCTPFLSEHPGGADSITMVAGEDASDDFMAIHSETAKLMLQKYHIGTLEREDDDSDATTVVEKDAVKAISDTFLEAKAWKPTKLLRREDISKDTRIFHFELESPEQCSGLSVGQHVYLRLKDHTGTMVMRAYTPVSCHRTKGVLSLLVKVYFPSGESPGGLMSMALERLNIGDSIEVKGPVGSFQYLGGGIAKHKGQTMKATSLYMVSGGSGITPCYQIMKELVYDSNDPTRAMLMFGNKQVEDIVCRDELEEFVARSSSRLSVDYWLSRLPLPPGWKHKSGRIDANILDSIVERSNDESSMLLVCGPDGMVNAVKNWAQQSGYPSERLVIF